MRGVKLRVRAFVHATESEDRVAQALVWSLACDSEKEGRSRLDVTRLRGHHGNPILVLAATLGRPKDVARFMDRLRQAAGDVAGTLAAEASDRMDPEGVLHFRLDKQAAVQRRHELTRSSDAFQFEIAFDRVPGRAIVEDVRAMLVHGPD